MTQTLLASIPSLPGHVTRMNSTDPAMTYGGRCFVSA